MRVNSLFLKPNESTRPDQSIVYRSRSTKPNHHPTAERRGNLLHRLVQKRTCNEGRSLQNDSKEVDASEFEVSPLLVITYNWLVVSTHLKNISQIGNLPQIGVKIKKIETTTQISLYTVIPASLRDPFIKTTSSL